MARVEDVEIFADDGNAVGSDEDAVEFGGRRPPRWANVAGGALVAAIFIGIVATSPQPKSATPGPEQSAPDVVSTADPSTVGRFGPVLHLDGAADVRDAVVHRNQLFVLRSAGVSVVELAARKVTSMPLTGAYSVSAKAPTRLLFDADADRLWVVAMGAKAAQLVEFNASRTLTIRRVTLPLAVRDAAAMDGHVYLATSTGLADLAPGATHATALAGAHGAVSAMAADPARDRILALESDGSDTVVVAVSTHGAASRVTLGQIRNGSIAIVGGAIWVAGYDGHHPVVARVDPVSLALVQTSVVAPKGDRIVVSAGTDDVWVSGSGPGLWCIAADNGILHQYWPSATAPVASQRGHGPVQSRAGSAYVIDAGRLVSLDLAGCAG
jgi:hypothetical protein